MTESRIYFQPARVNNNVTVLNGDGNGGLPVHVDSNRAAPRAITVADFNGDGKQDFVTANYGSNSISVRLGDGNGGFHG